MIRVLIVDDDKLARKGLISIMPWSSHGMVVAGEAANGAKALEFLEQQEVDLMFVDLSMPVVSGTELIQAARKKYPNVRSVVFTFHEEFENVQTAYRLGVLDYISKARLELEDDGQILERIRFKMSEEKRQPQSDASPATIQTKSIEPGDEQQWRNLEKDWRSLYWLYNEGIFQRLCKRTEEANPSVRRLEGLFLRAVSQLEAAARWEAEIGTEAEDVRSALEGIRRYRQTVYSQVAKSNDFTNTTVCMLKAALFVQERASEPLHSEEVAEYVHMSRSYFCQCFKKLTGSTFNDYLRQERVRAAERLLCETDRPVSWVAHEVGYGDSKYFSQVFYEQNRMHPSEFRARFHTGSDDRRRSNNRPPT